MTHTPLSFPSSLLDALRVARHIAVLTGAGMSAESGVPTFRDAQTGLWAQFKPEELATREAFRRDPRFVLQWYAWRRELVSRARPHAGHQALMEMERRAPRFTLITQNVDGLHQLAGQREVIELHGNIRREKCFECDAPSNREPVAPGEADDLPRCVRCGGLLRPDVVWFGEMLPERALIAARDAAAECDVFLSIGTSGVVEPAASLPRLAARALATVVHVNPDVEDQASPGLYRIRGQAGQALPALLSAAFG